MTTGAALRLTTTSALSLQISAKQGQAMSLT